MATDADLRPLIFAHSHVLVKFADKTCLICQALAPKMTALARDPRFAHVLFPRIDAGENPVAAQEVRFTRAPFLAACRDARLEHGETVFTEARVEEILLQCLPLS
ncbi:MAG: hypothetical protein H7330_00725 [Hymenobacteraceae bacterium]|nr:hypothetical protein [Hymenobacteraceae bacterium]